MPEEQEKLVEGEARRLVGLPEFTRTSFQTKRYFKSMVTFSIFPVKLNGSSLVKSTSEPRSVLTSAPSSRECLGLLATNCSRLLFDRQQ